MGRPLNKKYFGNFNIGTGGYTAAPFGNIGGDDGIGGEGIASINWSEQGSWLAVAGVPLSGLQLPAPTLPGGVQAAWTLTYGADAVTTGAGNTGLVIGDVYTYAPIPGSRIAVTNTGTNATFNVTVAGTTSTLLTDTQTVSINKVTGTGTSTFTVDVFMQIVDSTITEKGSGYTGDETITVTTANSATGTVPAGTIVLTTDSGARAAGKNYNVATNQDNAIVIHANVGGEGGTLVGDIREQVGSRRYRVTTSDGTAVCKLVADNTPATKEAYVQATDDNGNTYYVVKLTAHRATLIQWVNNEADWLYADNAVAGWTFGSPVAPGDSNHAQGLVTIENA